MGIKTFSLLCALPEGLKVKLGLETIQDIYGNASLAGTPQALEKTKDHSSTLLELPRPLLTRADTNRVRG